MATSLLIPIGYSTKKALYRSQCRTPGTALNWLNAKYVYRITSVVAHASSMDEYHALELR